MWILEIPGAHRVFQILFLHRIDMRPWVHTVTNEIMALKKKKNSKQQSKYLKSFTTQRL